MATINITILDDFGQEIVMEEQKLPTDLDNIDKIESAVETFRRQMLPQISKHLLERSQKAYKKGRLASNGSYTVTVKTVNGSFSFNLLRFKTVLGSSNYFKESKMFSTVGYQSKKLINFVSYYATK